MIVDGTPRGSEGEARYRAMFTDSPLPMWVLDDRTLAFVEVNEAAVQHYGYAREEFLAMSIADLRLPEEASRCRDEISDELLASHSTTTRQRKKDGTIVHTELHCRSFTHEGRAAWFVVANDITARVHADEARVKAESRFARLVDTGILGVIVVHLDGGIIDVNDTIVKMLGYSREELLSGQVPWTSLTPEKWRHVDVPAIADLRSGGVAPLREKEYFKKDGTLLPVLVGAAILEGTSDECIAFVLDLTERKRAEAADRQLREERAAHTRLKSLIEAAPDAIVIVNRAGIIELVNAQTELMFGYGRTELLGRPAETLIPERFRAPDPEHRATFFAELRVSAKGSRLELCGVRKDGSEFPIEIGQSPIQTDDGVLVSSVIRDCTQRKLTEDARAKLSAIVDSSDDAIISETLDGTITSWNQAATRILGYAGEEVIGKSVSILVPPGHVDQEPRILAQLRAKQRVEPFETVSRSKDGRDVEVFVTVSPIRSASGEVIGAARVARDIGDRKKAERRFSALLESGPDAIVIFDEKTGRIAHVNRQTEHLFGYRRSELLGQPLETLMPERLRNRYPGYHDGFIHTPRVNPMGWELQLYGQRKDGTELPVELSLSPLETDEGTLIASSIRDISERLLAATALRLANRELEAFSYSAAHDLRAPLRSMHSFAQILLGEYAEKLDGEGRAFLDKIVLNARKMDALIDALLSLSRVTRTELRPDMVDLSATFRSVMAALATADPDRSVKVVVQDDLRGEIDPRLARAVFENLCGNAWKFTSKLAAARIELGVTDEDGSPAFFVRDNGAGFDMAYANKLFVAFQRLHTAAEFAGTGIGLATVQRIIHRHGGRIWAEGVVGAGATFYFTLPGRSPGTRR